MCGEVSSICLLLSPDVIQHTRNYSEGFFLKSSPHFIYNDFATFFPLRATQNSLSYSLAHTEPLLFLMDRGGLKALKKYLQQNYLIQIKIHLKLFFASDRLIEWNEIENVNNYWRLLKPCRSFYTSLSVLLSVSDSK